MQQSSYLDVLKERYRFDEWKEAGTAGGERMDPLTFSGDEFPGWRLTRQARREPSGHPPFVRTIWQGSSPDNILGIDVFECASPAEAREYLLHRLGEFQGPTLERADSLGAGDIAFATPGETVVVFSRGRNVAVLHNGGRRVESLGGVASALDRLLGGGDRGERR